MHYEIVGRVPDELKEATYLREDDLEKIANNKFHLLHFLRKSEYDRLSDFPCKGGFERRLRYSRIEGPFESRQDVQKQDWDSERSSEAIELLFPLNQIPGFERISLVKYGTRIDEDSTRHIYFSERDPKKIDAIGERVLKNLKEMCDLQEDPCGRYSAFDNRWVIEFSKEEGFEVPLVRIDLFVRGKLPKEILQKSGIYELSEQFNEWDRKVGIKDSTREGLAWNLNIEGKTIQEMTEGDNVLL